MLTILEGNCLATLPTIPDASVQMCATSPPYFGLRNYGGSALDFSAGSYAPLAGLPVVEYPAWSGHLGGEPDPAMFIGHLVEVFREVKRVLTKDGTFWLNLGDSSGSGKGGNPVPGKQATNRGSASWVASSRTNAAQTNGTRTHEARSFAKNLHMIPARVALALQADGWVLRSDIIWDKPNPMPESVTDRPTRAHEYIFLLSKSQRYYYNADAIKEPCVGGADGHGGAEARKSRQKPDAKCFPHDRRNGMRPDKQRGHSRRHDGFNDRWDAMERDEQCSGMRNKRDVWTVAPANYPEAHFATWPKALVLPMILAGSRAGDTILDPFFGSGTTGEVAIENGRRCIGCEMNPNYIALARRRCETTIGLPLHA